MSDCPTGPTNLDSTVRGVTFCCYLHIWLPPSSYVVFLTTLVFCIADWMHRRLWQKCVHWYQWLVRYLISNCKYEMFQVIFHLVRCFPFSSYPLSTIKHLLFAWPYFHKVITLDIFMRLYFCDLSHIVHEFLHQKLLARTSFSGLSAFANLCKIKSSRIKSVFNSI